MFGNLIFSLVGDRKSAQLLITLSAVVVCLLIFASDLPAQVSAPGWTPPAVPKAAEKVQHVPLAERAAKGEAPLSLKYPNLKTEAARLHRLPPPDPRELHRSEPQKKLRVGIIRPFPQPIEALADSSSYQTAEGRLHLFRVISEGALQLRLHFTEVALPEGALLFVYSARNPDEFYGPYQSSGPNASGRFWTPPVKGQEVVVEYLAPPAELRGAAGASSPFSISEVSHVYRDPLAGRDARSGVTGSNLSGAGGNQTQDAAGPCHLNVTDQWAETAKSVGFYQFVTREGEAACTGTLMNNTKNDGTPYFLTANHCLSDQSEAQSVRVYWFYDSGNTPPAETPRTDGAMLLTTGQHGDYTLLRLTGPLPAGVHFAGWAVEVVPSSTPVVGIHHPSGSYKRFSAGNTVPNNCQPGSEAPCDSHWAVQWNAGVTEAGSSGSGLWMNGPEGPQLVGMLSGGYSSCQNPFGLDYYGGFYFAWGGLHDYLRPITCDDLTLNPTGVNITFKGGITSTLVTALQNCRWQIVNPAPWIKLKSPTEAGYGIAPVVMEVERNHGPERSATLTIGSKTFTVTQQAVQCDPMLSPDRLILRSAGPDGGITVSFTVSDLPTCAWKAESSAGWITVLSGQSGVGNGTVTFKVNNNDGPGRAGSISVYDPTRPRRPDDPSLQFWQNGRLAVTSAASYGPNIAAGSIAVIFGSELAYDAVAATTTPLPVAINRTRVTVIDAAGTERAAPLFFVSPQQVNFLVPDETSPGRAEVVVMDHYDRVSNVFLDIGRLSPALFAANADGQGLAAALALRVKADGAQSYEPVAQFDAAQNKFISLPIDLGDPADQVFLVLFGTGIRHRSALSAVTAKVGGAEVEVLYAGAQGGFVGLDQVNLRLPRSLIGRSEVDVVLTVEGKAANTVRVHFK